MNRDFLKLYEAELIHIRERGVEFAAAHPEIASRLALSPNRTETCPDPFVERLLEGFAFLTARVQLKLESEFPRFTQGILETVFPDYMAPQPATTVVQITPKWDDEQLLKGMEVPRLTSIVAACRTGEKCEFRTAHSVTLFPLKVVSAKYHVKDVASLKLNLRTQPAAALCIRLALHKPDEQKIADLECDKLCFFLHGKSDSRVPGDLLENLLSPAPKDKDSPADGNCVIVRSPRGITSTTIPRTSLRHAGFEEDEAMLPPSPRTFEGHRILHEHFLLPQRHLFLEIKGLRTALGAVSGGEVEIIIPVFRRRENADQPLPDDLFQLYCTPAINLFPMRSNRIPLVKGLSEFQVVMDRTRTLDYEVYSIRRVIGYRRASSVQQEFHPFYLQPAYKQNVAGFYSVFRDQRQFSEVENRERAYGDQFDRHREFSSKHKYRGSEVFLSLVDRQSLPFSPDLEELQVDAMCTNRHLPLDLVMGGGLTDFYPTDPGKIASVKALVGPTHPRPSFAEGRHAWRAISHLSLNYLSLIENGPASAVATQGEDRPAPASGVEALRELLRLYAIGKDATVNAMIDGIRSVKSTTGLARSPGGGPIAFIRGTEIELTVDEEGFLGAGVFLLASVLEQFFARHVSINHFTRLTLHTDNRKEVMRWPARVGKIPIC